MSDSTANNCDWPAALVCWYHAHRRDMPWREEPSPYRVWISEIMLQQTRVDTVIPYFERFLTAFPSVSVLAAADEHTVLSHWQGLGYYSRARNLLKAARRVAQDHDGRLPSTLAELRALPGFGDYTAAAVASIAFGVHEPVVDGNVLRVVSRLDAMDDDIAKPQTRSKVAERLRAAISGTVPGDFNQAMMELGATLCTPRSPACLICPVRPACRAAANGEVQLYPVKTRKGKPPHYPVAACLVETADAILLQQRPAGGMLAGLWDLPQVRLAPEAAPTAADAARVVAFVAPVPDEAPFLLTPHAYTHFSITIHTWRCRMEKAVPPPQESGCRWINIITELPNWPIPTSTARILQAAGLRQ